MADTITGTAVIGLRFEFEGSDNRLITMPNYRPNITKSDISNVSNIFKNKEILIGDKAGTKCTGISESYIQDKTSTKLDIS